MTWRIMPTSLPTGTRTCTAPCVEKNFFTLDFWQVTLTMKNSSGASASSGTASWWVASHGRSQSSVVLRPILSQASIGWRACSRRLLHCLPHGESGCMLCSAPGIVARKARPMTSMALSSCTASEASSDGGTRNTDMSLTSKSACCRTQFRKSATVALTAQLTVASLSGKCVTTFRCLWLGGSTLKKMLSARPLASSPKKCGANSITSRLRNSSLWTSLSKMDWEVFPPC
mmetsp:Transcript_139039/g.432568  ORF Transcript_139039/g.432568 Transcript_139039/m.432568 type:complete len:230 (+) Transcript_139039:559-1248(+)